MNMKVKRLSTKRMAVLSVVIAVLVLAMAGTTLAVLMDKSNNVKNVFNPTEVTCEVVEPGWNDGNTVKENVSIENTGDVDAYIRAAIVVNWIDKDGNIAPVAAIEGSDYTLVTESTKWERGADGYYYYTESIASGVSTEALIKSISPAVDKSQDGYTLSVEILADAIQADGGSEVGGEWQYAVEQAWGVKVNVDEDGNRYISKQ